MPDFRRSHRASLLLDPLDDRCLLSAYTPAQITGAYGLNEITFTSPTGSTVVGNGSGQTIALIEEYHDPNIQSDLHTFDVTYGLPDPSLTVVNQAGHRTDNSWSSEESMDVEYAHAIAPGARILVVEAAPASNPTRELQNQLEAVNTARHTKGVDVISMSWGFPESPRDVTYDQYFTTPGGHPGITFIASSGDLGYAEYPASSPNVLSVGGTSLHLTSSGAYQSETAWLLSGGSYSSYEPEPNYQRSVQTTGQRATPDVAFDANQNTGVEVYETPPGSGEGSWQVSGGTSLGAPAWAGIIAIADQGRTLADKGSLDGPTQTLPTLYALPSSAFHSVAPVTPVGGLSSWLWYIFGSGSNGATANLATGLGSPDGQSLSGGLVASDITAPAPTAGGHGRGDLSPRGATLPTKPAGHVSKQHRRIRHGHTAHPAIPSSSRVVLRLVVAQGSRTGKPASPHKGQS